MAIDRMAIDDIGASSIELARELHRQLDYKFGRLPLEEVANDLEIKKIVKKPLQNVEGALFTPPGKAYGEILLNTAKDERRTHFTLAHELGHYLHPLHHGGFSCNNKDLYTGQSANNSSHEIREAEANTFAAELLMPAMHMDAFYCEDANINCQQLVELSDKLFVSGEALFRRIAENNRRPVAAYFIKDNKVRYFQTSSCFPKPKVWSRQYVPSQTISSMYDGNENSVSIVESGVESHWLRFPDGNRLSEQTFKQKNGYQITLLQLT